MSRTTLAIDRLVVLLLGVVLILVAAAGLVWSLRLWSGIKRSQDLSTLDSQVATSWWPFALAGAGLLLLLLGALWLLSHLRSKRVSRLTLSGSSSGQVLEASAGSVASAAAECFADTLGVRSARGHVERDRGQLVVALAARIESYASLSVISKRADDVSAMVVRSLGRDDLHCRVELKTAGPRRGGSGPAGSAPRLVR